MQAGTVLATPGASDRTFSLDDRYLREEGVIYATGVQALVRLLLDQARSDRRSGLRTAGFVSGYPGSPVATVDLELERRKAMLDEHDILHVPGLNEDLAATAVFGSQLAQASPGARFDGVFGMWFGKAPGVDRTGDAFRHGNFKGMSRHGGVLAVAGDDPGASSSILPSDSSVALFDLYMPILYPADVQEVLDLGLHGYQLSRMSGLAVGLKFVTAVADSSQTAWVGPDRIDARIPEVTVDGKPFQPTLTVNEGGPRLIDAERLIHEGRLEAVRAYARENRLNQLQGSPSTGTLGIVAGGKTYLDVIQALRRLGVDPDLPQRHGLRLLKLNLLWPLDQAEIRAFASRLDEVVVVEEKREFVELLVKDALYGASSAPRVVGKRDEHGDKLLPSHGELTPEIIGDVLASRLARVPGLEHLGRREPEPARPGLPALPLLSAGAATPEASGAATAEASAASRTPYFCSGCPHSRGLEVPEGSLVGAGIGCHVMQTFMDRKQFGEVLGYTHMGGEGAQWVGIEPFTESKHIFQNVGDGTFSHSGSLAIRFAIATGATITFKILHNAAVAMTGGQEVTGGFTVPEMARLLEVEGVKRVIITSEEPDRYKRVRLPAFAEVRHRDDIVEAETELARTPGVTVLIHDQQCAAEARRLRKRGLQETPNRSVYINERACEGCGDCGEKSNCLSVQPVDTEFGRRTAIHQSSCNKDYSCLLGDCPSFVSVVQKGSRKKTRPDRAVLPVVAIDDPTPRVPEDDFAVHMSGIGGTGVVTVSQILATAAFLAGRHIRGLDRLGGAQKAGPVESHLHISTQPRVGPNAVSESEADTLLVFDLLVGTTSKSLDVANVDRTVAIVSTARVPTGQMIADVSASFPEVEGLVGKLEQRTATTFRLDPTVIAERLLGNHLAANMILLGAGYQLGGVPVSEEHIHEAIRINGTAVEMNLDAFAWGRLAVARPDLLEQALQPPAAEEPVEAKSLPQDLEARLAWAEGEVRRLLTIRVHDLIGYQDVAYAHRYLDTVTRVHEVEQEIVAGQTALTETVARNLHRLMAYKDEYEVARLSLDETERARIETDFGTDIKVYWHLHPPVLRALGLKRKLAFGSWFTPVFLVLRWMKRLRGTPLDLFGYARVRRVERALVVHYRHLVDRLLDELSPDSHADAVKLAGLADMVRGYEDIKLANVERYEVELASLGEQVELEPVASVLP